MSPRPSTSGTAKRRVLHERTPSQTNEGSPNRSPKEKQGIDIYSATPYPTKPTQVFLPRPGIGQPYAHHGAYGVSDVSLASAQTDHTATGPADEHHHLDAGPHAPWEFSSSVDLGHSSSQVWDDDPQSSQSSFPTPLLPSDDPDEHDVTYHDDKSILSFQHVDVESKYQPHSESGPVDARGTEEDEAEDDDDDDVVTLPPPLRTTVKTVFPEHSSPRTELATSDNYVTYEHSSSPNVVPIGAPSSPNFVAYDSSSPNLIAYDSSSPRIMTHVPSDSTGSSSNSLGTVIRTYTGNPGWPGPSPEPNSSQPASFTSSPPEQLLREYQSASSLALSAGTQLSRTRTASSGSGPSEGSSQFGPENTAAIQYPRICEPSSSSSYAESFNPGSQARRAVRTASDRSTGRWNPTLSTVPSNTPTSINNQPTSSDRQGLGLIPAKKSKLSIGSVDDNTEHLDRLSSLPRSTLRHIPSSLMGSNESRPGSSSSGNVILNMLPNWVRLYYHSNGQYTQNPAQSILETSRPATAASRPASPIRYVNQAPDNLSLPRIRPNDKRVQPTRLLEDHPADPRNHWKRGQGEKDSSSEISVPQPVAKPHSPHLHPDKGQTSPRHTWLAPSLDSRNEPALGRRNVQVYSFCLGFVFPLAWVIAAFLPLPPQPSGVDEEMVAGASAKYRIQQHEKRRYQSARWWRNVNRVMIPVGTAIIAIIVTLAVVGTTTGFS
ncbi:uncharacterized protein TRUGW13939_07225 [Talaromyces rugulosus]|uniref:Serine-rich protein n=1 Tax=Talaromyces rugulosus TaxID=121627 RepID=A0A7H8R5F4_TALRU|nr:uncharacterized protein TRUGW13939_07225 [Talaromyces rugulosus]QKX60083.1 hypothetical protein TRUGW13939_07225 [Talaromyces rugulosus]